MKVRVMVESPFSAKKFPAEELDKYARRCMKDSLDRGESPFMSHMLYPKRTGGVLDDDDPEERQQGLDGHNNWLKVAQLVAVYVDYNISPGMEDAMNRAGKYSVPVKVRRIGRNPGEIEVKNVEPSSSA